MAYKGTVLEVKLNKVEINARFVVDTCHRSGVEVLGVAKGVHADRRIVRSMLQAGVAGLADARLENICRLRKKGFSVPMTLLRIPRMSRLDTIVRNVDVSVNSELSVMKGLSEKALVHGFPHSVVLMIDVGDLREGVMPENVIPTVRGIQALRGVELCGLGTNIGCFGGVVPTRENLGLLVDLAREIEKTLGISVPVVSGGGTSSFSTLVAGGMPVGINQLRIGEGILLGFDTVHNQEIAGLFRDAFVLYSEVIEVKLKPSVPIGIIGLDAFGNQPVFEDHGLRKRAIVALGRQDANPESLFPLDPGVVILGASSDHMILDVQDCPEPVKVGDHLRFLPNYSGLVRLTASRYVQKKYLGGSDDPDS